MMATGPDPNPMNASLPYGQDFVLLPNGSIAFVKQLQRLRQRLIRRIFTNPREVLQNGMTVASDYLFDQQYGVGASRAVGQLTKKAFLSDMESRIRKGVMIDEGVDATVMPKITFMATGDRFFASVKITTIEGYEETINFPVG